MKGEFKIKEKMGKPIYAHIILTVIENNKNELIINFDNNLPYETKLSIEFGILYYYQQYIKLSKKVGLSVNIDYVHGIPVDTTAIVLCYSAIKAMADALAFEIKGLLITENGDFIFSKGI